MYKITKIINNYETIALVFDEHGLYSLGKAIDDNLVNKHEIGFGLGRNDNKTNVDIAHIRPNEAVFAGFDVLNDETVAVFRNSNVIADEYNSVVFEAFARKTNLDAVFGVNEKF